MMPALRDDSVVTLGPEGTDSHRQAASKFKTVILQETFSHAIRTAENAAVNLLLPAGMREWRHDRLFTWIDFHFGHIDRFRLQECWSAPTMPMLVVRHADQGVLAIHPATEPLVPKEFAHMELRYTRSKMEALSLFLAGAVQAAIVSENIAPIPDTDIVRRLTPSMVWCLYEVRREAAS